MHDKHVCLSCILSLVLRRLAVPFPYDRLGMYPIGRQKPVLFLAVWLNSVRVNMMGVRDNVPCKSVWDLSLKGFVIWHRFDFTYSILDYCFRVYFGTATYVDYLMFSHLNLITNPTPQPNATLTIGATARNPKYQGSCVYSNYRGSCTQP